MQSWVDCHPIEGPIRCGDFVECWELGSSQQAVVVGDIAGRGIEAGAAAVAVRTCAHTVLNRGVPLASALRVAWSTFEGLKGDAIPFCSLFVGVLDAESCRLRYASAGHEPGLLFSTDGTHEHLDPTGPVLGIGATPIFSDRSLPVHPDDVLVVVTDGITEARRAKADRLSFFGSSGVVRAVNEALRSGRDPARAICRAAFAHAGGRITDDASVVVSGMSSEMLVAHRPRRRQRQ